MNKLEIHGKIAAALFRVVEDKTRIFLYNEQGVYEETPKLSYQQLKEVTPVCIFGDNVFFRNHEEDKHLDFWMSLYFGHDIISEAGCVRVVKGTKRLPVDYKEKMSENKKFFDKIRDEEKA